MTLMSAYEDFVRRTLPCLRTRWQKLGYIADLKTESGRYSHWGLARVHGEEAAESSIAQAHAEVWVDILRTPMSVLMKELEETASDEVGGPEQCLVRLKHGAVVPRQLNGGSPQHFRSIVATLSALSRAERNANSEAA
jgi:hypothetical protein